MAGEGDQEGPWGPPDPESMAELLEKRYPLRPGERVSVGLRSSTTPGLGLALDSPHDRYELTVDYLRGADGRDPWALLIDALDALFGTFIESRREYRDLPRGTDVGFEGAFFRVDVTHTIPALVRRADRLLDPDDQTHH